MKPVKNGRVAVRLDKRFEWLHSFSRQANPRILLKHKWRNSREDEAAEACVTS
jgi:hypothetical protein